MKVSYSRISTFQGCSYEHKLRYIDGLYPIRVEKPLYKGSAIHELLEQRAKHLINPEEMTWQQYLKDVLSPKYDLLADSDKELIGDFINDAEKIMKQYDWVYENETVIYKETEKWIERILFNAKDEPLIFVGKVDAIVELNGKQYLLEHKTFSSTKMSLGDAWINFQASVYAYVLNKYYGYHIEGVLWDLIKSEPYSDPNILKNGSYGKQPGTVTLMSFSSNPGPEVLDQVKDNHYNFLTRFITPLVPNAVDVFWKQLVKISRMMYFQKDKIIAVKNLTRDCSWCSYKDICQAELTGGDVEYIKTLLFSRKEEKPSGVPIASEASE